MLAFVWAQTQFMNLFIAARDAILVLPAPTPHGCSCCRLRSKSL